MIDIHNHIVPGVDDGIKEMAQSLEALRLARAEGIRRMVLTPHAWPGMYNNTPGTLARPFAELQEAWGKEGGGVELELACEAYYDTQLPERVEQEKVLPMGGGKYLLVELPLQMMPMGVDQIFYQLRLMGVEPILAHPERMPYFQRDITALQVLIEHGLYTQVTAASLTGYFGKPVRKLAEQLVKAGWVQFVGSDTHSVTGRKPVGQAVMQALEDLGGRPLMQAICHDNPGAMLAGDHVARTPAISSEPPKRSFFDRLLGK